MFLDPCPLPLDPASYTLDELKRFGLQLQQPKEGYRFTLDPLLLCDFTNAGSEQSIADLGTGCGVMALILARMAPEAQLLAVEKEELMATLARQNATSNNLDDRVRVLHDDLLHIRIHLPVSCCDLVVSNPPYRKQGRGRPNPDPGRMVGRHETTAGVEEFLAAAKYLVKPSGRICIVHHPARLPEFMAVAAALKLSVRRMRMVHGCSGADAKVFLAELTKGGRTGDTKVLPPLLVRHDGQDYTDEVRKILLGKLYAGTKKAGNRSAPLYKQIVS